MLPQPVIFINSVVSCFFYILKSARDAELIKRLYLNKQADIKKTFCFKND